MAKNRFSHLKALVFDVQGTATDFRGTLVDEAQRISRGRVSDFDWGSFVDQWRALYRPALDDVLSGASPWRSVDSIYREALDKLLKKSGLDFFNDLERKELNFGWQKIRPWPDVVQGLEKIKQKFKIATLSNADVKAVINISKFGNLPWDALFAAEMAQTFKPDPRTYQMALQFLGLDANEVMMVACHKYDLFAAKDLGMKTGFIARPLEFGPDGNVDIAFDDAFDINGVDFIDLAAQLGC